MADINQTATVTTIVNGEQAEETLKMLQEEAKRLRKEINQAYNVGDTKRQKELEKQLKNNTREATLLKKSMFDVDSVLKNLSGASVNELQKALKKLNNELNSGKIKRGSAEWNTYTNNIKRLKAELSAIQAEMRATQSTWERMNNAFNKWGAMAASVIASITGISLAFSQMRKLAYAQEESAANLKALTGLDDRSIEWLKQQAAELSTTMTESGVRIRQSSTEILEAYMLVGSAKPDLLQNKEALNQVTTEALKLATAAKMDMKEAVDAVTLSMNQYGAAANEAARYTNVMAAGSKYGSANVQSVTTAVIKSGVAASAANVPIEQLVGAIETLAEKGIKDEIAGTGLKKFFLTLQTGADETNPKIVGLEQAVQNLADKELSATEIKKMFGEEGYNVAQVLLSNVEAMKQYTAAVTGTAVAEEQAAINSQTRQAKLDQMKNQMAEVAIQIVNDLNPAIIRLGNTFTNLLKIMPPIINFIKNYGVVIVSTGASITAYIAILKAQELWTKANTFANEKLIGSFKKLASVVKTNPWGAVAAAIGVAVGFLVKFVRENNKLTESMKAQQRIAKKTEDQYAEQAAKVEMLYATLKNESIALDRRKQALLDIQKIIPGYHAQLTEEEELINDNADAVRNYLTELEKQIRLQAVQEELTELYKRKIAATKNVDSAQKNYDRAYSYAGTLTGQAQNSAYINAANFEKTLNKAKKEQKEITDAITVLEEELNASGLFTEGYEEKIKAVDEWLTKELNLIKEKLNEKLITEDQYEKESLQAEIEASKKKLDILEKAAGKESAIYQSTYSHYLDLQRQLKQLGKNGTVNPLTDDDPTKGKKEKYEELLELVDNWLTSETNILKEKRNAQLLKEDEYQKGTVQLALEAAQRKLDILKAEVGEESAIYQNAYSRFLDIQHQLNNPKKQDDTTVVSTDNKDEKRRQALKKFGLWTDEMELNQSLSILEQYYADALLDEDEYQQARQALLDAYNQKEIEKEKAKRQQIADLAYSTLDQILGATEGYINAAADAEVAKTEAKYDRMIEAAGNNTAQQEQLEKQKEEEVNRIKAEAADKSFGLQIAMAIASTAQSAINAYSSAAAIPVVGWIMGPIAAAAAAAAGAIQLATIKQQHSAAKANYWTGGYTPDGAWNEEQGTVHSGEFVANRFAVRNPAIRPVLDLIDTAQKNNTIASITSTDVSRSLGNSPSAPSVVALDASYFDAATQRFGYAAERLSKQLDKPIEATVTIEGRNGLAEQWDKYNRLKKNKGN